MSWLNLDWTYRKLITITGQTGAGTSYQVPILIENTEQSGSSANLDLEGNSANFPSAKDDGGDLRFTSDDGTTLLDFWVQEVTGGVAKIWVEVADSLESNVNIYVYYGNSESGLANGSSGEDTFNFFDDFTGAVLDGTKWDTSDAPSVDGSDNLILNNDDAVLGKTIFGVGYEVRCLAIADEQDITFVGFADLVVSATNKLIVANSDADYNDDFDTFKIVPVKAGA